ncbi:ABC transporter permease, partial [Staphylococcus aureus]|nr:ABC transporter permease [Staphylococcus aureus]
MRNTNKFLLIPYLLWMVIFIIVPVVLLIYFSFLDINGHFSFTNYQQIFTKKY